jgi:DNA-binding beta-propeller fold protein YncE
MPAPSRSTLCLLLTVSAVAPLRAQTTSGASYHVVQRVAVGGDGGWDGLLADVDGRRLYLSHGAQVEVLDLDGLSPVGTIPNTHGVHGIAVAPDYGRGFTSNGRDTTVTVFDLPTLKVLGTVRVSGANPDAILYEPLSHRVLTFNGGGHNATVIDAITSKVIGTIALSGKPEFAVTDGRGTIYVNIEDRSTIAAIDARTMTVSAEWSLAPCESPSGLAIDRAHRRLFSACGNQVMVISDPEAGQVIASVPIGEGVDGAGFDPERQLAFSSNGAGTLSVIRELTPDRYEPAATVPTQRGARTMAVDPTTGRVFTVSADYGPAPVPTSERPAPRPSIVPGSFTLLVVGP